MEWASKIENVPSPKTPYFFAITGCHDTFEVPEGWLFRNRSKARRHGVGVPDCCPSAPVFVSRRGAVSSLRVGLLQNQQQFFLGPPIASLYANSMVSISACSDNFLECKQAAGSDLKLRLCAPALRSRRGPSLEPGLLVITKHTHKIHTR